MSILSSRDSCRKGVEAHAIKSKSAPQHSHRHGPDLILHLTFRLVDGVPKRLQPSKSLGCEPDDAGTLVRGSRS